MPTFFYTYIHFCLLLFYSPHPRLVQGYIDAIQRDYWDKGKLNITVKYIFSLIMNPGENSLSVHINISDATFKVKYGQFRKFVNQGVNFSNWNYQHKLYIILKGIVQAVGKYKSEMHLTKFKVTKAVIMRPIKYCCLTTSEMNYTILVF